MNTNHIVSNFELLYNRIAPIQGNLPANAIARRVVQAHFLSISNLEYQRPVYFSVSYVTNDSNGNDANREFINPNNFILIYDGNSQNNVVLTNTETTLISTNVAPFPFKSYKTLKTRNLLVNPGETALLALFPNFSVQNLNPSLEIRGHITIRQEANANNETNPYINQPANVLISSEHRGTFLEDDFNGINQEFNIGNIRIGFDFDQLQYSLPLANGKSHYILDGI